MTRCAGMAFEGGPSCHNHYSSSCSLSQVIAELIKFLQDRLGVTFNALTADCGSAGAEAAYAHGAGLCAAVQWAQRVGGCRATAGAVPQAEITGAMIISLTSLPSLTWTTPLRFHGARRWLHRMDGCRAAT